MVDFSKINESETIEERERIMAEENAKEGINLTQINRLEIIDNEAGRIFVRSGDYEISWSVQDFGKTLKFFIKRKEGGTLEINDSAAPINITNNFR
jgi:hypothetical protein